MLDPSYVPQIDPSRIIRRLTSNFTESLTAAESKAAQYAALAEQLFEENAALKDELVKEKEKNVENFSKPKIEAVRRRAD